MLVVSGFCHGGCCEDLIQILARIEAHQFHGACCATRIGLTGRKSPVCNGASCLLSSVLLGSCIMMYESCPLHMLEGTWLCRPQLCLWQQSGAGVCSECSMCLAEGTAGNSHRRCSTVHCMALSGLTIGRFATTRWVGASSAVPAVMLPLWGLAADALAAWVACLLCAVECCTHTSHRQNAASGCRCGQCLCTAVSVCWWRTCICILKFLCDQV